MIGRTLLHFTILDKLGEGGMGEVYLAQDTKLGRQVALKFLSPERAADEKVRERFVREALAVAAFNHPNIVTLYSVEEVEGKRFFVMELVEGETLDNLIPPGGFPLQRFLELAIPLAAALDAAYRRGITHRDLKPQNVMVSRDGRVKVLDFGLAKPLDRAAGGSDSASRVSELTQEGFVVGTARYMSPEQARGQEVDHRADLFSLGIIFYEMVTGTYPFNALSLADLVSAILRDVPPAVPQVRAELPDELGEIISRCLEKRPEDRFQEPRELLHRLRGLESSQRSGETAEPEAPARQRPEDPLLTPRGPVETATVVERAVAPGLAVLPLKNLSGDPDYFVEGLTEELTTAIAKIRSLRVISRQSMVRFRDSAKPLPEIAAEVKVKMLLEGSVLRVGDRVRITVQLMRADPEEQIWSESYERDVGEVLALQSEVARSIAYEIRVHVSSRDANRLAKVVAVPAAVVDHYLQGRFFWNQRSMEGFRQAIACFNEAIAGAPRHASSFAGLADCYALMAQRVVEPEPYTRRAKAAAIRALELDPELGEAHASLGFVKFFFDWDWEGAETSLRRALELSPNYATAHTWYAGLLAAIGRKPEGLEEIRRAQEIDPLSPIVGTLMGYHHELAGDLETAISIHRSVLDTSPDFLPALLYLWCAYQQSGRLDQACQTFQQALVVLGQEEIANEMEKTFVREGYGPASETAARLLRSSDGGDPVLPVETQAFLYLANDNRNEALELVRNAFTRHSQVLVQAKVAPEWEPLRSEPEFQEMLALMSFPEQAAE